MITIRAFNGRNGKEIELTKEQLYCLENSEFIKKDLERKDIYNKPTATCYLIDATEVWIVHYPKYFAMMIEYEIGYMKNEGSWKL